MGLILAQCIFVKMFIMQMVVIYKGNNRKSVDGFVFLSLHLEAERCLQKGIYSCESEIKDQLLSVNSWFRFP